MTVAAHWLPSALPWAPPAYDEAVVYAYRAFREGTANEGQQKLLARYIDYVTHASDEFADLSFRPDDRGGERASAFAEGKRWVGMTLRKLLRPELTPKPKTPAPKKERPADEPYRPAGLKLKTVKRGRTR